MPTKQNKKPTRPAPVKQPAKGHPARSGSFCPACERRFKELVAFKREHGDCRVSLQSKTHEALANWVHTVRKRRKLGNLSEAQVRRLDELGFTWSRASDWAKRLQELKAFKKKHGHCNVPYQSKTHAALGHWVHNQRHIRARGELSEERIRRLDELGLTWSFTGVWEKYLSELEAFKKQHGHCNVSSQSKTHAALARWVTAQRHHRKKGTLSEERVRRLDELGIAPSYAANLWEEHFSELEAFRREHGHCKISTASKTHAALGNWVRAQRERRKQGKLSEERIERLDRLGFVWDGRQEPATTGSSLQSTAAQRSVAPRPKSPRD